MMFSKTLLCAGILLVSHLGTPAMAMNAEKKPPSDDRSNGSLSADSEYFIVRSSDTDKENSKLESTITSPPRPPPIQTKRSPRAGSSPKTSPTSQLEQLLNRINDVPSPRTMTNMIAARDQADEASANWLEENPTHIIKCHGGCKLLLPDGTCAHAHRHVALTPRGTNKAAEIVGTAGKNIAGGAMCIIAHDNRYNAAITPYRRNPKIEIQEWIASDPNILTAETWRNPKIEHQEWIATDPHIDDDLRVLKIGDKIEVNYHDKRSVPPTSTWCDATYEGRDRTCRPGYGSVRYADTPKRILGCRLKTRSVRIKKQQSVHQPE